MKKIIEFNGKVTEELTQGQKLEKLAMTLKSIKMIDTDNNLQRTYTQQFWKKLWEYTQGPYYTISHTEYSELVKVANKIVEAQNELEFILKRMISSTIEIIENV